MSEELDDPNTVYIDGLSLASLYLKTYFNDTHLGYGTGFIAVYEDKPFLITAGHVLTGRDADTNDLLDKEMGSVPNVVRINQHLKGPLGRWRFDRESLYDSEGKPLWLVHRLGPKVDVVALELKNIKPDVQIHAFDRSMADADVLPYPAMQVSVIGFPLGLRPNVFWPIWKTGHIASDFDLDYKETLPAFLIDATTRSGMSGSPVVVRAQGGYMNKKRIWIAGSTVTRFLGVYSGRIHKDAEIGIVWRPSVIDEVLEWDERGTLPY